MCFGTGKDASNLKHALLFFSQKIFLGNEYLYHSNNIVCNMAMVFNGVKRKQMMQHHLTNSMPIFISAPIHNTYTSSWNASHESTFTINIWSNKRLILNEFMKWRSNLYSWTSKWNCFKQNEKILQLLDIEYVGKVYIYNLNWNMIKYCYR